MNWNAELRFGVIQTIRYAESEFGAPMYWLPCHRFGKGLDMPVPPRNKRDYLCQLVEGKNKAFRPLTDEEMALGFLGWHERGNLPHCDYPGLVQFVTIRLADSMPASRRGEWEHLLAIEDVRKKRTKLEEYLDRGIGECHLRDPHMAKLAENVLLHFHGQRHELLAWCVMPNHVHVLVHVWQTPLWKTVQSWKHFIQTQANYCLRNAGFQHGVISTTPTCRAGGRRSNGSVNIGTRSCGMKSGNKRPFVTSKTIR